MQHVLDSYPIQGSIQSYRRVYLVDNQPKQWILKQLRVGTVQTFLIGQLLAAGQGCPMLPELAKTTAGYSYLWRGGNRYLLTARFAGREADYLILDDFKKAIQTMAAFHKFSLHLLQEDSNRWALLDFNPRVVWQQRLRELDICRKRAIRRQDWFSKQYLKLWSLFSEQAFQALEEILKLKKPGSETLCYHDWACHNLIIQDETACLIDFDYIIRDSTAHDRANLAGRYLRLHQWSVESLFKLLWNFDRFYYWKKGELKAFRVYLLFPYDYWMLGRQYFIEQQPWSKKFFQDQWDRKIAGSEKRLEILNLINQIE